MSETTRWHRVARLDEIEDGEPFPVSVGRHEIALCRVDGEIYAIGNVCTHEYAQLSDGYVEGDCVECPLHQALFHIPTGRAMSPPAEVALPTYPARVEGDVILVEVADE